MQLKTNWDFSALNLTDENLQATQKIVTEFSSKWQTREDYLQDPQTLLQALTEYDDMSKNFGLTGDAGYYWGLRHSLEQNNPEVTAAMNRIDEIGTNLQNQIQFFGIKLSKIPLPKQQEFLASEILAEYRHFLQKTFAEGKYVLTEPEEKILNLKANVARGNWIKLTETLLSQQNYKGKILPQLLSNLKSGSKKVRDQAAVGINKILKDNVEIAEHELNSLLADKKINDELRKCSRPDALRHLGDDIDSQIVDALVKSVSDRFDLSARYYRLKAKALGLEKLDYHDRVADVGKISGKYNFEKSCQIVSQTFHELDEEFGEIFDKFVANGQIDAFPKAGKRDGAFCAVERLTTPTYILLNHTDKLQDVLTIAHEAGHGINNELMRKQQTREVNFGLQLSTAEVASTFMEDFVLQKLLSSTKPEQKFALIMQKLDADISTIFRQVACYMFETELHRVFREKGYLSYKEIGQIFQKHMTAYMGSAVNQPEDAANWWVYWSHIRNYFYVYSYASGLLISKSLQSQVKHDKNFIGKVKEFLSAGLSDSPSAIFKRLNINIEDDQFWQTGLKEVESLIAEAEKLCP